MKTSLIIFALACSLSTGAYAGTSSSKLAAPLVSPVHTKTAVAGSQNTPGTLDGAAEDLNGPGLGNGLGGGPTPPLGNGSTGRATSAYAAADCATSLILHGVSSTQYTFTVLGGQLNNVQINGGTINGYPLPIEQIHAYCRGYLHDNFCQGGMIVPPPDGFQYTYGPDHILDTFSCH